MPNPRPDGADLAAQFYQARTSVMTSTGALPAPVAKLALADALAAMLIESGAQPGTRAFATELRAFAQGVAARAAEMRALGEATKTGLY